MVAEVKISSLRDRPLCRNGLEVRPCQVWTMHRVIGPGPELAATSPLRPSRLSDLRPTGELCAAPAAATVLRLGRCEWIRVRDGLCHVTTF